MVTFLQWGPSRKCMFLCCAFLGATAHAAPPGFGGPPKPLFATNNMSRWRDKRLMFVGAHPDDIEYFAGGTISTLRELDLNVTTAYFVVTNGNAGGACYNFTTGEPHTAGYVCEREELAFLRRREMLAAGRFLGAEHVWRGGFDDGMLISYHESMVRERISAYIRRFQPHAIFTHYPYPNFRAPQTCNGACTTPFESWDDLGAWRPTTNGTPSPRSTHLTARSAPTHLRPRIIINISQATTRTTSVSASMC